MPVHFPAARGPASVCVMAQRFDVNNPRNAQDKVISATDRVVFRTSAAGSMAAPQRSNPPTTKDLRTRVGFFPAAIRRSDVQPETSDDAAMAKSGIEPSRAIALMEKPRSVTR